MSTINVQEILDFEESRKRGAPLENGVEDAKRAKETEAREILQEEELLKAIEEETVEPLDENSLKKMVQNVQKKLLKNQEMRIKHAEEPTKFMESEEELNVAVQELHAVAAFPSLYPIFMENGAVTLLLQILSHENTDLSLAVISLLQELTDVEGSGEEEEEAVKALVSALIQNQLFALLVQNIERLDESNRDEADGVNSALSIVENVMEIEGSAYKLCIEQGFMPWLLRRVRQKGPFDGNKLYASELLSVLLQQSENARETIGSLSGIDVLLQSLASYKRHNPGSADEREFMMNLFDALCAALLHKPNRILFLEGEGLQLMNLMLREKKDSRFAALKVLDYATTGVEGKENCEKFVDILGLRTLFPLFMKTPSKQKRKDTSSEEHEEHTCAIINSLLRSCSAGNRSRVVDKFTEQDLAKVDRLVELFLKYSERVRKREVALNKEAEGMDDEERYLLKLDGGLFTLQLVSLIMAEVCTTGPASIRERMAKLMAMKGGHMGRVKKAVDEYRSHLGPEATEEHKRTTRLLEAL